MENHAWEASMKRVCCASFFLKTFGLLLLIVAFSSNGLAQGTNGTITGNVKDASGGVIAAATVTVTRVDTNEQKTAQTDPSGNYSLLALPPAVYDLQVQNQGFNTYSQKGVKVDVSSAVQINVVMTVGTTATTVEVAAESVRVETVNAQIGKTIEGNNMQNMPLNGRSYVDLMALQPGVNSVSTAAAGAAPGYASHAAGNISINGHSEESNGYQVNGGDVEQVRINGAAVIPNMDSIAEFKIITNNVDAEYGHYSGGLITVVTKSGTNQFHGSAFEYLRNTSFDAANFFIPQVGQFNRNQFGGTFGGPVKKDKAFFFVDYQGTREVQANNSGGVVQVPTLAERGGNFSDPAASALLAGNTVGGTYWAGILSSRLGYPVTNGEQYYFGGTTPCTTTAQCVFPGAIIPNVAFDPTIPNLLPLIVKPNNGTSGFVGTGALADNVRTRQDQGSARFDYNAHRWGSLAAYYSITDEAILRPYGSNVVPSPTSPVNDTVHSQQWNISDTKTFGSSAVNEFRINYLRDFTWVGRPVSFGPTLAQLGFVTPYCTDPTDSRCPVIGGKPVPGGITFADPLDAGAPILDFAGEFAFNAGVPSFDYQTYQDTPQVIENFSKIFGSHTTKFGVEWQYARFHQRFPAQQADGEFSFDGSETGSAIADFLLGAPAGVQQGSDINYDNRKTYIGIYAEDSWKIKSNLTLNYGLRWDFIQNWWERNNATSDTYIAGEQSTVFPTAPLGLVFAGDKNPLGGTIPRGVERTPKNNFAPRIGIAWSPNPQNGFLSKLLGSGGKTSIRAAWGLFYTNNVGEQAYAITGQAPFVSVYNGVTPDLLSQPYTDRATGLIEQAPSFPNYIPPPPGTSGNFKGCATCPVGPINWLEPINGDPVYSVYNVTPYADDYHVTIQRQFGGATVFSVGYVGSQGHHLLSESPQQYGSAALCLQLIAAGATPKCGSHLEQTVFAVPAGFPALCPGGAACNVNGLDQPFGINFAQDEIYATNGNSHYHSLQVSLEHSSGRLTMLASFNYSRSEDDLTYNESAYNPIDRTLSRNLSNFDVPKSFVFSYNYLLPVDRLSKSRWLAGWHLAGITTFTNGLPITLSESGDRSYTGVSWDVPLYNGQPLNVGMNNPRSGLPYFNTKAFTAEPKGTLNTAGKRTFVGPGINNFDMSLLKETKITEHTNLEFRAEFFNVWNHAQFLNPTGSFTSSTFGIVNSARDPRIGQLALKFLF
jgi:hypothetical protein